MKKLAISILTLLAFALVLSGSEKQSPSQRQSESQVSMTIISKEDNYQAWLKQKRAFQNSRSIEKIPIEEYQGDLKDLPLGAFIKQEAKRNLRTGERIIQKYVILQAQ